VAVYTFSTGMPVFLACVPHKPHAVSHPGGCDPFLARYAPDAAIKLATDGIEGGAIRSVPEADHGLKQKRDSSPDFTTKQGAALRTINDALLRSQAR
jgi:hypothetical protein